MSKAEFQLDRIVGDKNERTQNFSHMAINSEFKDVHRLREYEKDRDRVLVLKIAKHWQRRLKFLSLEKLKTYRTAVLSAMTLAGAILGFSQRGGTF